MPESDRSSSSGPRRRGGRRAAGRSRENDRRPDRAAPGAAGVRRDASDSVDPRERAREICLGLLAHRPRTRAELATALRRRDVPADVAQEVLDRFGEVGMIDDAAFARAWVTSRHQGKGLARRALGYELRRRGVDGEIVGDALEQLDPGTEEETARALVDRRLRSLGSATPDAAFRRLVGMLARKGYPPGVALTVVRDALAARPDTATFVEEAAPQLDALTDVAGSDEPASWRYPSPVEDPPD